MRIGDESAGQLGRSPAPLARSKAGPMDPPLTPVQGASFGDVPPPPKDPLGSAAPGLPLAFPLEELERMAKEWLRLNACKLDGRYELGFSFYRDPEGKIQTTHLVQGEEAEVDLPDPPPGGVLLGSLHTHVGCDATLSEFDEEEGQRIANELGSPYAVFVVGPDPFDEEAMGLEFDVFEPEV